MSESLPIILGVIAVGLLVYALTTRKNGLEARAVLADTAIRYQAALAQLKQNEQNGRSQKDQAEKWRVQAQKAEKQAEDIKNRTSDNKLELIRLKTESEAASLKFASQKEHLLEQVQVLTSQLSEVVREKKLQADELNAVRREVEERTQKATETLRAQLLEVQSQLVQARRDRSNAVAAHEKTKQESGLVKPEELKRWQLKVARLEQLYSSMKGLREMAEERNENWETALRFFASHILGTSGANITGPGSIGALVGAALEKIGATLVVDDTEAPYELAAAASEAAPALAPRLTEPAADALS